MNSALALHTLQTGKTTTYLNVRSRDWTRFGKSHEGTVDRGHHAAVTPGKSIRLFGTMDRYVMNAATGLREPAMVKYDRTFKIGDTCERDSYNIVFLGTIVAIGAKTITIQHEHSSKKTRLSIERFSRKNRDFDLEQIRRRNSEWND